MKVFTISMGSPSSSATMAVITVSEPCPMSWEPMYRVAMPRLFMRRVTQAELWLGASSTANPVPDTNPVPAKPMPSPFFILSFFSYQPISFAAVSRVSLYAQLVIASPAGATYPGSAALILRNSTGSMPIWSAANCMFRSCAKCTWQAVYPLMAPADGLLV